MKLKALIIPGTLLVLAFWGLLGSTTVLAFEDTAQQLFPADFGSNRVLSAAIAFAAASLAAGWAISKAGSAGLAGSAERPEIRTTAIIIAALGEALAIYGIVIVIFILGASGGA